MQPDLEIALVHRLRTGGTSAFDEIYAAYNRRLRGFLARSTKNRSVAEDLLEETWLRLIESAEGLDADTRLGSWLFTVARNLYLSHCRSRVREHAYTSDLVLFWPSELPQSPLDVASSSQLEQQLETAIAALPPMYREVLLLVGVEQLRPMDAAKVCGISPETFRQKLSRARAMVSRYLTADVPSNETVHKETNHGE